MELKDIKTFGEHDAATVAQIERSASHEAVAGATLCADGHKGYAVPIGGVLAYEGHISPSGVGFDIACFTGEQEVMLADGRRVSMLRLIEESEQGRENYIYSLTPDGEVILDRVEAPRRTGFASELVVVTLDNGEKIRCTPGHIFYLRTGEEVTAEALFPGMSLMPLYLSAYKDVPDEQRANNGKRFKMEEYQAVYVPRDGKYQLVHHLADDYNIRHGLDSAANGPIRHHVDFDKLNNNPPNVRRMEWKSHFQIHSDSARERALKGEIGLKRARELNPSLFSEVSSRTMSLLHTRPDFVARRNERAKTNLAKSYASDKWKRVSADAGQRNKRYLIAFNQSEEGRAQASRNTNRPRTCKACGQRFANQSEWLSHWHASHKTAAQEQYRIEQLRKKNHAVVAVERVALDAPIPVYCLTAPQYHTFALAAGVFVHNCGNKAVLTNADAADVHANIKTIMDDVWKALSFGVGLNNKDERVEHDLFDDPTWKMQPMKSLKQMAQNQLGTIGSGNHYVDIFEDERERVWVGVHFGSRGLGHKTATHFLKAGGAKDGMDVDPLVLPVDTPLGEDYIACMTLAGRYAYAGRDWVCSRVARILGADILEEVHNHHNWAWLESHGGRDLWVVRKGATPAFPGQKGFVGGSMGDVSVIIEGVDSEQSRAALYSTVHGAGRVMSRTAARGKINYRTKEVIYPGAVSREMMMAWVRGKGVELRGAGTDESPHCYKRLEHVLRHHNGTIRVLHYLRPLGVAMAGEHEHDPYKD